MRPAKIELLDPLTGIYSRASLKNRLQEEVDRSMRYGQPFSILLLDLDHFKSVNDAFGHRRGDDVLIALAGRLSNLARKSDVVFRYGGDEFIILLPSTDKAAAIELAGRLFARLGEKPFSGSPPLKLTSSMGVASFPEEADSPEGLFDIADKRHYQAKRLGRNRIVSEDAVARDGLGFVTATRVVDREMALDKVYAFFDALGTNKQGALAVVGQPGMGKSRFLEEVAKIGRLHGHLVLPVAGKRALKSRARGALLEAEQAWGDLPSISDGEGAFLRGLEELLIDKGNIGAVFTIDNLEALDRQSLATLERIVFSPLLPHVAIAYSHGDDSFSPYFSDAQLNEVIRLKPFSKDGLHIWLRQVLRWEAPEDFIVWLHESTNGMPERLRLSLHMLADEGFLARDTGGWTLKENTPHGHYQNFPLSFWLKQDEQVSKGNLPNDLTTFVGRTVELRNLKKSIMNDRLVSLTGPGGIGKTRLALQAAIELQEEFPDGSFYVPLAGVDSNGSDQKQSLLTTLVANALGVSLAGKDKILDQLLHFLANKRILLLLNNYENMISASPVLEAILDSAPRVKILLSSREPSNLPDEELLELAGLDVPESEQVPGARHFEAVQLFSLHARRAEPEFTINDKNMAGVVKVCRLVGGMPLGIELAASWVSQFTSAEIAGKIEENFTFLARAHPEENPGDQSIQAVFDSFWALLSETERSVLARLSTFENDFTGTAAQQVAGASPFFLGALTNRVFLIRSSGGDYRMHELLRQYAARILSENPGEAAEARLAHSRYFLRNLHSRTLDLRGKQQKEAQEYITGNSDNIQTAWSWALKHQQYELIDTAAKTLFLFYDNQGRYREGATVFRSGAMLMEASSSEAGRRKTAFQNAYSRVKLRGAIFYSLLGFISEAKEMIETCLQNAIKNEDDEEMALCYEHIGWLNYDLGQPRQQVHEIWKKSLAIYRAIHSPWGIARVLYNLSFISPLEENQALMREKLEITTEAGDLIGVADTLLSLGSIHEQIGETEKAKNYHARSLKIYEQVGNLDGVAFAHFGFGNIDYSQGKYENALASFERALHIFRQTGNVNGMSTSLSRTCRVAIDQGDYERAREGLNDCLAIERQSGSQIGTAYALNYLGELALAERKLPEARRKLEESYRIIRGAEDEWGLGRSLANLARLANLEGDHPAALQHAKDGLEVAGRMGETLFVHSGTLAAGVAALGLNDFAEAERYLIEALDQANRRSSPPLMLATMLAIARLCARLSCTQKAAEILQMVSRHPATIFRDRRQACDLLKGDTAPLIRPSEIDELARQVRNLLEHGIDA